MEEELTFENIVSGEGLDSFLGNADNGDNNPFSLIGEEDTDSSQEEISEQKTNSKKYNQAVEIDGDNIFSESEGVNSDENDDKGNTEGSFETKDNSSPTLFSSITKSFVEEGIFQDLSDEEISNVKSPEDFKELVNKTVASMVDAENKRALEALNAGVAKSEIKTNEDILNYLGSIKEEDIEELNEKGEALRRQLIYYDLINKGVKPEKAKSRVDRIVKDGTDIEDAKDALEENKEFFKNKYENLIAEAKKEKENAAKEQKKQMEDLRKSIIDDDKVFADFSVDKATRTKIFENITKPIVKDKETGQYLTAIQSYQKNHPNEFAKMLGFFYTLTDGFKTTDNLVKDKVKKEVAKGFKNLEKTLNNTSRNSDGSLKYSSGTDDIESSIHKGWSLDI